MINSFKLKNILSSFFLVLGLVFVFSCSADNNSNKFGFDRFNSYNREDDAGAQDDDLQDEGEDIQPCEDCIEFRSADEFSLGFRFMDKNLNLEYSSDKKNWNEWQFSNTNAYHLSSMPSSKGDDELYHFYVRGNNNLKITNGQSSSSTLHTNVVASKSTIKLECLGNIETLLDWQTVANGRHPQMGEKAFAYLFDSCQDLVSAPELLSTELSDGCYMGMFQFCSNLKKAPSILPAKNVAKKAYQFMFEECRELEDIPYIPASSADSNSNNPFEKMFESCDKIVISETETADCKVPFVVEVDMIAIKSSESTGGALSLKKNKVYYKKTSFGDQEINVDDYKDSTNPQTEPSNPNPSPKPSVATSSTVPIKAKVKTGKPKLQTGVRVSVPKK